MNYEQKYKEALERAMKLALTGNVSALAAGEIFPELKRTVEIDKMVDEFAHTEVKGYGIPSTIEVDAYRKGIEDALEKQGKQTQLGCEHADIPQKDFAPIEPKSLEECIEAATPIWKGVDVEKYIDEVRGRDE